jgi:hypothetical protein
MEVDVVEAEAKELKEEEEGAEENAHADIKYV